MTKASLGEVAIAAANKFGECVSITIEERNDFADFYHVVCKRSNPVFKDSPFMTITGRADRTGDISFHSGAYDLNEATAFERLATHAARHAEMQRTDALRAEDGRDRRYSHKSVA